MAVDVERRVLGRKLDTLPGQVLDTKPGAKGGRTGLLVRNLLSELERKGGE
jgi:hypothetical protein